MTSEPRPIDLHRRLPGYAPSRVVELDMTDRPGRVLVTLETERFGLPSFKVLGASWAVARRVGTWLGGEAASAADLAALTQALHRRGRRPTVLAATDGNHGRAVAWTARQLDCPADIFVPAGTATARIEAIRGEGATVHVVDGDYDDTVASAAASTTDDRLLVQDTTVPGHATGVDAVVDGYATIFDELESQLGPDVDGAGPLVLVVPVGVGSLAVAAARYLRRRGGGRLVTVEPVEAASLRRSLELGRLTSLPGPHTSCMVGLRCGSISTDAWPELQAATDLAVAIEDGEADAAMRWLAERDVVVGECGAAALAAFRQADADGRIGSMLNSVAGTAVLVATEAPTDPSRWRAVVGRAPT